MPLQLPNFTHCEQAAPLDTAGSCGICPNEAAVGSGAIVSATAKARCGGAGGPAGIPLASCRQHARCN
jgi:hypothetical protein